MIDPRFAAAAGAIPFVAPGYGVQQMPVQRQHHHRHHRHHRGKHGPTDGSPLSRDESIHKVDHARPYFQQSGGALYGSGYGVPYNAGGYAAGAPGGFYLPQQQQQQQQQPYAGYNYGFSNQYPGAGYDQIPYGVASVPPVLKHHRHHHHHRHHNAGEEASAGAATGAGVDADQGASEQLIGQRSSSVVGNEASQVRSPLPAGTEGEQRRKHHHRRHHRYHQNGQYAGAGQQSQVPQGLAASGAGGYGHINEELIFIERGNHSPHRQEPPSGYDYKGKIEVQNVDREHHSHSHFQGQGSVTPAVPSSVPLPQSVPQSSGVGLCPPGWQQMILSANPGGQYTPGGSLYAGQLVGGTGTGQAGLGGIGSFGGSSGGVGFGGVAPTGAAGSGGGLANLAASLPIPSHGQLVADYIVDGSTGGVSSAGASGFLNEYQQTGGASFATQQQSEQADEQSTGRARIIEVWQKRNKHPGEEEPYGASAQVTRSPRTRSPRTQSPRPRNSRADSSHDFERFRHELLGAIERIVQSGGSGTRLHSIGHDGGTQTQINPSTPYDTKRQTERRTITSGTGGEVRVVVQPVQPVFYMPRNTETGTSTTSSIPQFGSAPSIQQTSSGASNVIYVPRNVYVPVIKPVFVPKERVIVRPQVIHVARPVLVDRPVPVTQRPIIVDRERPVLVPLRNGGGGGGQGATQTSTSRTVHEEYAYGNNVPAESGGYSTEFSAAGNYDYMPTQQEHQYSASSAHEVASDYQTQGPVINVTVPEQYQHSHSATHLDVEQSAGSFHESYANLGQVNSASVANVAPLHCTDPIPIEVLDTTVNPSWQRTDKTHLVNRYGRPAFDIVQKTDHIEQQMYQELRQRSNSGHIQRSDSAASYGSGAGLAVGGSSAFGASSGSFSSVPLGDIRNLNAEGLSHQGSIPLPVCINY